MADFVSKVINLRFHKSRAFIGHLSNCQLSKKDFTMELVHNDVFVLACHLRILNKLNVE